MAALLVEPEDACIARWAELEDSGLKQEVAKYRKAVIARERDLENVEPTNFEYEEEIEVEVEENGTPDDEAAAIRDPRRWWRRARLRRRARTGRRTGSSRATWTTSIRPSGWCRPKCIDPRQRRHLRLEQALRETRLRCHHDGPALATRHRESHPRRVPRVQPAHRPVYCRPSHPQAPEERLPICLGHQRKYQWTLEQFKKWGYEFVDRDRLGQGHQQPPSRQVTQFLPPARQGGVPRGRRGEAPWHGRQGCGQRHHIFAPRRELKAQKPTEIYELIEEMVPGGKYLEIFARKNNLSRLLVSVGLQGHRHEACHRRMFCVRLKVPSRREVQCSQQ